MHRYSHCIYIYILILAHKQTKQSSLLQATRIPPVVTSGQARRLRRHCLVPCASSFPRVQAPKLPCADCSASAMWPCCMWSLLHVEPLHVCDLPAATLKLLSPLSSFAPAFLSLPLSAPQIKSSTCHHKCAQASPLCSVYSLPVYIYRGSPSQPTNGLHRRDDHVHRPLGRRGA